MTLTIEDSYLDAIYQEVDKGKSKYDPVIKKKFRKTILLLKTLKNLAEVRKIKGLNFEALKGDFKGKHSVRVDIRYRIILRVEKDRILVEDILVIEDLTNHYR
jgi:proteic killer suppression protein